MLGGTVWETTTPLLHQADVMALRTSARQYNKLELGVSGFALRHMQQAMEGPLWRMTSPLFAPDDVVKLRTVAKERNRGSTYGPHGELFFFMMQNPYESPGEH